MTDGQWNSQLLHDAYELLGWFSFLSWSLSFYPQAILNYRRKSVVGLNFDFLVFNLTKHTSYLIFNASMFFSATVQEQYRQKYGQHEIIPVSSSDVAFSVHAVTLTLFTCWQACTYERGGQRVSFICKSVSSLVWLTAALLFAFALSHSYWLWLVTSFNYIQLLMTTIKYIPQAWSNFRRRSTLGWSVGNVLLDVAGGIGSFVMMALQALDQGSLVNFSGNAGKVGLSLETVLFDALFIFQHYVLYPDSHAHHHPLSPPTSSRSPSSRGPHKGGDATAPLLARRDVINGAAGTDAAAV